MTDPFNSDYRELDRHEDMNDESVYCVTCGMIYIPHHTADGSRECPACTLDERLTEIEEQLNGGENE